MIPSAPTAHRSNPPPVNMLYMFNKPPAPAFPGAESKYFLNASPSNPGTGTNEASRQIASTRTVKPMRDFSSGILRQLFRVLRMDVNIGNSLGRLFVRFGRFLAFRLGRRFQIDNLTGAAQLFDFGPGRGAERVRMNGQFAGQLTITQNLHPLLPAIGYPQVAQGGLADRRAILELVQGLQIHRNIAYCELRVVK